MSRLWTLEEAAAEVVKVLDRLCAEDEAAGGTLRTFVHEDPSTCARCDRGAHLAPEFLGQLDLLCLDVDRAEAEPIEQGPPVTVDELVAAAREGRLVFEDEADDEGRDPS